jgi:hypothetical protein
MSDLFLEYAHRRGVGFLQARHVVLGRIASTFCDALMEMRLRAARCC